MNRINPAKLHHSKWTAAQPVNREKHFLVTKVITDSKKVPQRCVLEAVASQRTVELDWRELKDSAQWRMGWLD